MLAASIAPWLARRGIHYGWVMMALTFLVAITSSAAVTLPGVLILPMTKEFGWGLGDFGGPVGLMLVLFGVMAPFAGALMLRYGLRTIVVVSGALATLALLGITRADALWHLWISIGLMLGVSAGIVALVLSATVANRWFATHRGLVMGILTAVYAAGQLTFLPTAAWLSTQYGWRLAVLPALIGCAVSAVLYALFARDWPADVGLPPNGETTIQRPPTVGAGNVVTLSLETVREAVSFPAFWILCGTFFVCGLSTSGVITQHFIPFCADNGVGAVQAASYLALMGVFNFVGTVCSGWLSDRFDNRILLAWYYGLRGLSLVMLPFSNFDVLALSIFAIFFGLDFVATIPPTVKLTAQHFGTVKAPILFGWIFASHQVGGAISAFMSGASRDAFLTYLPAYIAAGFACLIAAMAIFALRDIRLAAVRAG